jgi:hypothetical protein
VHILHSQQGRSGSTVTRWPTSMAPVSEPSASTTPTISWPGWYGIGMKGCRPCAACVSDPQTPATTLRTSASCGRGSGTAASVTTSTWSAWTTTRRITVGAVGVDMRPLPRRRKQRMSNNMPRPRAAPGVRSRGRHCPQAWVRGQRSWRAQLRVTVPQVVRCRQCGGVRTRVGMAILII